LQSSLSCCFRSQACCYRCQEWYGAACDRLLLVMRIHSSI
jgi:hypothetical protein